MDPCLVINLVGKCHINAGWGSVLKCMKTNGKNIRTTNDMYIFEMRVIIFYIIKMNVAFNEKHNEIQQVPN
jgi:hypothetical protein